MYCHPRHRRHYRTPRLHLPERQADLQLQEWQPEYNRQEQKYHSDKDVSTRFQDTLWYSRRTGTVPRRRWSLQSCLMCTMLSYLP